MPKTRGSVERSMMVDDGGGGSGCSVVYSFTGIRLVSHMKETLVAV